jgi:hypothetical protein
MPADDRADFRQLLSSLEISLPTLVEGRLQMLDDLRGFASAPSTTVSVNPIIA